MFKNFLAYDYEYNVTLIVGKYDEHEMFVSLPGRENQ